MYEHASSAYVARSVLTKEARCCVARHYKEDYAIIRRMSQVGWCASRPACRAALDLMVTTARDECQIAA